MKNISKMKKKILVTLNDPGSTNAMSSVLHSLNQDKNLEIITIGEGASQQLLERKNVPYKTLASYGISDEPDAAKYLLELEKPNLVFTGIAEFYNMERYLLYFARINKIPSVSIIEGSDYSSVRLKNSKIDPKFIFNPDHLMVVDEFTLESMLKEGFKPESLKLTGHPGYDELLKLKQSFSLDDVLKVKKDLRIDRDGYLIIFLSQSWFNSIKQNPEENNGYNELTVLHQLENALYDLNIDKMSLLVKIHPREDLDHTRASLKGKLDRVFFDKNYDTKHAILTSDLVTGMFSLSLIEAVYLDKNVISLQPGLTKEDRLVTNRSGLSIPVYKTEDIKPTLWKTIYDEDFKAEMREKRSKLSLDDKATERAVEFIHKLLN